MPAVCAQSGSRHLSLLADFACAGVTVHIAPISAQFASSSASSLGLPLEARSTYFVVASDARLFPDFSLLRA